VAARAVYKEKVIVEKEIDGIERHKKKGRRVIKIEVKVKESSRLRWGDKTCPQKKKLPPRRKPTIRREGNLNEKYHGKSKALFCRRAEREEKNREKTDKMRQKEPTAGGGLNQ